MLKDTDLRSFYGFEFYTIGYAGKSIDKFLNILISRNIQTVVDVRALPLSRYNPSFSKKKLGQALIEKRIDYIHIPKLGVPKEIRKRLLDKKDYQWFFEWYDTTVISNGVLDSDELKSMKHPFALMCAEKDYRKCHRHRIALELVRRGLSGTNL